MKKIYLFYLCTLLAICGASAQTRSGGMADTEGKYRYNYVPVSPSAEALMKKITSPVNYNTGKVDVSIPLYEIRTKDFTLPLVLRYNSGGVKVSATNDIAGLGWTLDFGPSITRSIQGKPDEDGYIIYNQHFGSDDPSYLHKVTDGETHEQPDVFYYNTFDAQGCFVYKRPLNSSESRIYRPVYLPLTVDKVETSDPRYGFQVTDGAGNLYKFEEKELTNTNLLTAWRPKEIISPRNDKLIFSYVSNTINHREYYDYYSVEDASELGGQFLSYQPKTYCKGVDGKIEEYVMEGYEENVQDTLWGIFHKENDKGLTYDNYPGSTVEAKFPKEITYVNGKVTLSYSGGLLTEMCVYEKDIQIQRIVLNYQKMRYGGRALLKGVVFNDLVSGQSRNYAMEYDNSEGLEYSPTTKGVDRFGYYNGKEWNTDLVERQLVELNKPYDGGINAYHVYIGGADRNPDIDYAQHYNLYRLHYPSGAYEKFIYELNTYPGINENGNEALIYAGGLRIWGIEYRDVSGILKNTRRFVYEKDGVPQGNAPGVTFQDEFDKLYISYSVRTASRYRLYSSLPVADAGSAAGVSILYPYVTVFDINENGSQVCREDYEYDTHFAFPSIYNGMVHDEVNHYQKDRLLGKTDYDAGTNTVIRSEEYAPANLFAQDKLIIQGREVKRSDISVCDDPGLDVESNRFYRQYNYSIGPGNQRIVNHETVTTDYYGGKAVTNTVTNTFGTTDMDARTGLPVKETHTASDGSKKTISYTYPYHVSGNSGAQAMVAANDVMRPLSVNETTVGADGTKQAYQFDFRYATQSGLSSALLQEVKVTGHTGAAESMETYPVHDTHGNVCEIQRPDAPVTTLLWGYQYSNLVAIVEGASYNEVMSRLGITYDALQTLDGSALESKLTALRSAFPAPSKVTVFRHLPHRGIVSKNDPNGNVTTYTYDGMGRLTETRDHEGAVLQYNEYKK